MDGRDKPGHDEKTIRPSSPASGRDLDEAARAFGLACLADVAPVQNQPMMGVTLEAVGDRALERLLDFIRILSGRQAGAIRNAKNMRVDRDRRLAKGDVEHHVRRLAPDARQRLERRARARHRSAMLAAIARRMIFFAAATAKWFCVMRTAVACGRLARRGAPSRPTSLFTPASVLARAVPQQRVGS
jgi:hypothetical protein